MLDPSARSQTLNASSSAAALLFVAVGGAQLPSGQRAPLLASVLASSATPVLAAIVQTAMETDPFALQDGNAAISTALTAAVSAFTSSEANVSPRVTSVQTSGVFTITQASGPSQAFEYRNYTPPPASSESVEWMGSDLETQLSVFYLGNTTNAGITTSLDPATLLTSPADIPIFTTYTFTVPAQGDTDSVEQFGVVTLQPVFDSPDPTFLTNSQYLGYVPGWRASVADMYARAQVWVVSNYLLEAAGWGGWNVNLSGQGVPINVLQQGVVDFGQIGPSEQALLQAARTGTGFDSNTQAFISNATASDSAAQAYIEAIQNAFGVSAPPSSAIRISNLRGTILVFGLLGVFDSSNQTSSLIASLDYLNPMHAAAVPPNNLQWAGLYPAAWNFTTLDISPASATIGAGGTVAFTATISTLVNSNQSYVFDLTWTESSAYGTLDGDGTVGNPIETVIPNSVTPGNGTSNPIAITSPVVSYVSAPSDNAPVTVTVQGACCGSATATINFSPICGTTPLATGNVCCTDLTQGASCCGSTALASGNECCTDGTQGASCCGTTALASGNQCCSNLTQAPSCALTAWEGTWIGTITASCPGNYSGGLTYVISAAGANSINVDYGTGSYTATVTGNSAVCNSPYITLALSGNTITVSEPSTCQEGTLTLQTP